MGISRYNPFSVLLKRTPAGRQEASSRGRLKSIIETPIILAGLILGIVVRNMPASFFLSANYWILRTLSGSRRAGLTADFAGKLEAAHSLYKGLKKNHRREPAILCAISHPPVDKSLMWLNYEMIIRAFETITGVKKRSSKPRIVVAIDELAVGHTAGLVGSSMYAGWMHAMHLSVDRLPHARGYLKGLMLAGSEPQHMPWRLLRHLGSGGEVIIALSCGIPETGRAVYLIREFVARLRKSAGSSALARWRDAEEKLFLFALERGPDGRTPAESGILSPHMSDFVLRFVMDFGHTEIAARAHLESFKADFSRETAFRERFFNFLLKRIAKERVPLMLMGLTHGFPGPHVNLCDTISNTDADGKVMGRGGGGDQFMLTVKRWIELNFR
jgi:hypothetical protein